MAKLHSFRFRSLMILEKEKINEPVWKLNSAVTSGMNLRVVGMSCFGGSLPIHTYACLPACDAMHAKKILKLILMFFKEVKAVLLLLLLTPLYLRLAITVFTIVLR